MPTHTKAAPTSASPEHRGERLLTLAELGEATNTSLRYARRLIAERRIRFVKVGKHVRVPESALHEYLAAGTHEAVVR